MYQVTIRGEVQVAKSMCTVLCIVSHFRKHVLYSSVRGTSEYFVLQYLYRYFTKVLVLCTSKLRLLVLVLVNRTAQVQILESVE
jgi:hypothetical protein